MVSEEDATRSRDILQSAKVSSRLPLTIDHTFSPTTPRSSGSVTSPCNNV